MLDSTVEARRTTRRSGLLAIASLALTLLVLMVALPSSASADCTTGGSSCLPGSGYTGDRVWNCGSIGSGTNCHQGSSHSWGWGSASSSTGQYACVQGSGYFAGCAYSLARACFSASCNDQNAFQFALFVNHAGSAHVLHGHGKY